MRQSTTPPPRRWLPRVSLVLLLAGLLTIAVVRFSPRQYEPMPTPALSQSREGARVEREAWMLRELNRKRQQAQWLKAGVLLVVLSGGLYGYYHLRSR